MKQIRLTLLILGCFAIGSLCAQDAQEKSSSGSSTAVAGEPSSQEMRDAVQAKLDAYNDTMKRKIDACRSGDVQGNPVLAAQCLAVYAGGSNGKSDLHDQDHQVQEDRMCQCPVGRKARL